MNQLMIEDIADSYDGKNGDDQQRISQAGLELIHLLLRKNRDYGGSAFKRPILTPDLSAQSAIKVRMSDKIERINNLQKIEQSPEVEETVEDTWRDLAGYIILLLAFPKE